MTQEIDLPYDLKNEFPDKIKEIRGKGLLTAFEMHNDKHLCLHTWPCK